MDRMFEVESIIEKKMPGVIKAESEWEGMDLFVTVVAHAEAVNNMSETTYIQTIQNMVKDSLIKGEICHIILTKVRVESGLDGLKRELEEQEGILGVHLSPMEWDTQKVVTKMRVVISIDETRMEFSIFEGIFKQLAKDYNIRVPMKVDFVLYRPKNKSIII